MMVGVAAAWCLPAWPECHHQYPARRPVFTRRGWRRGGGTRRCRTNRWRLMGRTAAGGQFRQDGRDMLDVMGEEEEEEECYDCITLKEKTC